ncbi:MAG TPA: hypothetical protein VNO70_17770 [Blastocatellia bacterium]|nr:hypothetical protein [Blastocatellia bacterium]
MEATELLNAGDFRPTEMIAADDRPHRLTVSGIYELPFGQGKRLFADANRVVSRIISGWQINGIYTYQSGPPIGNWGNVIFTGSLGDVRLPRDRQTVQRWINTEAGFEKDPAKQLASNVRTFPNRFGFIRADYINNFDLSLFKNTRITEDVSLQFRAEFLNAFNTPLLFTSQINLNPTQVGFGSLTATTQENYPRRIQFALKLLF